MGGGGKAGYLNKLTAEATGKEVHAGPTEGTALGNITAQMIRSGEFTDKTEARNVIYPSFDIKVYR